MAQQLVGFLESARSAKQVDQSPPGGEFSSRDRDTEGVLSFC